MQAAIGDRIEAWVPMTEALLAAQIPRTLEEEEAEAAAEAEAVAVRPVQYRAVPPGRGAQRAAVHAIMSQGAVRKQQPDALVVEVTLILAYGWKGQAGWCRARGEKECVM